MWSEALCSVITAAPSRPTLVLLPLASCWGLHCCPMLGLHWYFMLGLHCCPMLGLHCYLMLGLHCYLIWGFNAASCWGFNATSCWASLLPHGGASLPLPARSPHYFLMMWVANGSLLVACLLPSAEICYSCLVKGTLLSPSGDNAASLCCWALTVSCWLSHCFTPTASSLLGVLLHASVKAVIAFLC